MKITITKKQEIVDDVAGEVRYALTFQQNEKNYDEYKISKSQLLQLRDKLNKVLNKE